eukprot:scaffold94_cov340-Prasinococcus_capsulatus_cf.AAC.1
MALARDRGSRRRGPRAPRGAHQAAEGAAGHAMEGGCRANEARRKDLGHPLTQQGRSSRGGRAPGGRSAEQEDEPIFMWGATSGAGLQLGLAQAGRPLRLNPSLARVRWAPAPASRDTGGAKGAPFGAKRGPLGAL